MRHDDDTTTAQRVSRILDQARRPEPPAEDNIWPQEWPPGSAGLQGDDDSPSSRSGLRLGARWQVSIPAAVGAAVVALLVAGLGVLLLLRGPAAGTSVPPRAPTSFGETPAGQDDVFGTAAPGPSAVDSAAGGPTAGGDPAASGGAAGVAGVESGLQVRVYVVGQVRSPGVVTLSGDARVEDAVEAVGGATAKADLAVMNLARKVVDGERIVVPRPGEKLPPSAEPVPDPAAGASAGGDAGGVVPGPGSPVDLNTATVAQLDALPGVGPVLAGRIVAWRQENGRFTTVDDLNEVQGIGDVTMEKLRPLVRV